MEQNKSSVSDRRLGQPGHSAMATRSVSHVAVLGFVLVCSVRDSSGMMIVQLRLQSNYSYSALARRRLAID